MFSASRTGYLELSIGGVGPVDTIGSNFAVLAYDAKRHADPAFSRDRFGSGPPPYPRPVHNGNLGSLRDIVSGFLSLLSEVRNSLNTRETGPAILM